MLNNETLRILRAGTSLRRLRSLFILVLIYLLETASLLSSASINSASQAIDACNEAIGLQSLTREKIAADKIIAQPRKFVDTTTPFVHSLLNGRPSWFVSYGQVCLLMDSLTKSETDTCTKLVTASLDSATGQLLQIDLYGVPDSVVGFQMPTAESAEWQIGGFTERFYGLPSGSPKISFVDALRMAGPWVEDSKHTRVHYLVASMQLTQKIDTFPAWFVYMRGTQLLETRPQPPGTFQHASILVNALTGKNFGIVNRPLPIPIPQRNGER